MGERSKSRKNKPEKFRRIKNLRCFEQVREMLTFGYPASKVARFIWDQGESKDIKFQSLIENLICYRREILPADVLVKRQPHVIINAKKQYTDKLEELKRMDDLYDALKHRFDSINAEWQMTGSADPEFLKTAQSIMNLVYKMHGIKMDLGISGARNLGTLTVSAERLAEISDKYGDGAARAMADPVSRARVLACLQRAQDVAILRGKEDGGGGEITVRKVDGDDNV